MKIWKELISEVDWKDVGKKLKKDFEATKERITDEVKAVAAMSVSERVDLLVNGEKHLGRLYQTGKIAFTRREWKGVEGTARDFVGWLKIWGTMSAMVKKRSHFHRRGSVRIPMVQFLFGPSRLCRP